MLGTEASRGSAGEPSDAGLQLGNRPSPGGVPHAIPSGGNPASPDALEEGGSNPKGNPEVGGARGDNSGTEGGESEGRAPVLDTGGRNNGGLDGACAGDTHDCCSGCPVWPQSRGENGQGEVPGDASDRVDAGVRAGVADNDSEGMKNLGDAVAEEPGG